MLLEIITVERGDGVGLMTVRQAAEKWGISTRRVQILIRGGRVPSAFKLSRDWVMPDDTPKPIDLRYGSKKTSD